MADTVTRKQLEDLARRVMTLEKIAGALSEAIRALQIATGTAPKP